MTEKKKLEGKKTKTTQVKPDSPQFYSSHVYYYFSLKMEMYTFMVCAVVQFSLFCDLSQYP